MQDISEDILCHVYLESTKMWFKRLKPDLSPQIHHFGTEVMFKEIWTIYFNNRTPITVFHYRTMQTIVQNNRNTLVKVNHQLTKWFGSCETATRGFEHLSDVDLDLDLI